ncbi:MAG: hypothetical protein SFV32_04990 [Opitutaceae bacterium]|nr:hypothetical protein [Opitutaceae bacterium]
MNTKSRSFAARVLSALERAVLIWARTPSPYYGFGRSYIQFR